MSDPRVSVLIPAFRAEASVMACLGSLLSGGNAQVPVEILLEADDGGSYAAAAALSPRVRVGCVGVIGSGAGPARNRALDRASAPLVACVDADDRVAADYLPRLLAAAAGGPAAAVTRVLQAGREVARFGRPGAALDFATLARHGASFRGLVPRANCPRFVDDLSQDVLHMVECLLRHGPMPVADTLYDLNLGPGTITAAGDFAGRVDGAYRRHVDRLAALYPGHEGLADAQAVFHARRALNRRFRAEALPGERFYAFIARVLPA